jgi:hypothetical protein
MNNDLAEKALAAVRRHVREQGIGNSLSGHDEVGEAEGFITDHTQFNGLSASTHILVKDIADILTKRYPGFRWAIQPSEFGKVFNIFCLDFHGRYGYVLKYSDIMNDPKRRYVLKAGKEILLRFGYKGDIYRPELMAEVKRNAQGEGIPNLSDKKNSRFKQRTEIEMALATGNARVVGQRGVGQVIEVRGKL